MKDLLTTEDVARLLHLHPKRIQGFARSGRLPAVRVGRRWLFPQSELSRAVSGIVASPPAAPSAPSAPRRSLRRRPDETFLEISARNQLRGRIVEITCGGVMAEVRVAIGGQELVSIITRSSAERLGLEVGAPVLAIVKSTEVMLARA